eukprot:TRINITY_DN5560_c0_g1_i3.p1 TRINITY_DN5560_c0_g1~~TRINITY_DN5560_c0_g1_i3.p1  ORF type:complete len:589 (-),score=66.14 TRINITY_DN5560_c0_g1_i3:67-1833(-)
MAHSLATIALLVFTVLAAAHLLPNVNAIVVQTKLGAVEGYTHDNLHAFLGIPFAEAPMGARRWAPPVAKAAWAPKTLNATAYSMCCPGAGDRIPGESEDCLSINVYVPLSFSAKNPNLPVMVWIYGGAFIRGCSAQPCYRGDFMANSTNTIMVSFNYRIGALGFLASDALQGNFGIMDQSLALRWVQDNIGAFGGNKSQVTLFGESAGGMSTAIHLTSPLSMKYQYYRNVIIQSDPFAVRFRTHEQTHVYAKTFYDKIGCAYDDLSCVRGKSWQDILTAQASTYAVPWEPKLFLTVLPWEPVVDNIIVTGQPMDLLRKGDFYKLPGSVILGTTENETLSFAYDFTSWLYNIYIYGWEYDVAVDYLFRDEASEVMKRYPVGWDGNGLNAAARMTADYLFICPTRNAALSLSSTLVDPQQSPGVTIPTYVFLFSYDTPHNPFIPWKYCHNRTSCHAAELLYVFHSAPYYPGFDFTPAEDILSWDMIRYWTNLAHYGTPNTNITSHWTIPVPPFSSKARMLKSSTLPEVLSPSNNELNSNRASSEPELAAEWFPYSRSSQKLIQLDVPAPFGIQNYHTDNCDYFDRVGYNF